MNNKRIETTTGELNGYDEQKEWLISIEDVVNRLATLSLGNEEDFEIKSVILMNAIKNNNLFLYDDKRCVPLTGGSILYTFDEVKLVTECIEERMNLDTKDFITNLISNSLNYQHKL